MIPRQQRCWFASLALLFIPLVWGATENLTAYTEEWAPYNYTEGGEIKGIATDILRAVCADAKLNCIINMVPWARGYALTLSTPNTLVYTTARKAEREKAFAWVGPILPRATWVYARSGVDAVPDSVAALPHFRIGVVRGEASTTDLQAAKVPASSLVVENSDAGVLKLLNAGLVDVMINTEAGMAWNLKLAGMEPGAVKKLFKFTDDGGYYFALNPKSDPTMITNMQSALDAMRKDGRLQALVRRY
ncbi:substrate-binding periplasmic protein [Chitinimonas sp. PSY-7]|uniref:transporter substrate-binding domain-containing protein n=1 Tax=Chitinimonas sp. PSY-7 TaxID=3459088 RepID=UPI00403FE64C